MKRSPESAWRIDDRDLRLSLALASGWLLLFLYVDPRGEFPLNDDFQYANSVRHLLASGELKLSPWCLASNLPHILLGAAGGLFAGAGNEALRMLMLALGCVSALGFFLMLRRDSASPNASLFGAAMLASSPLYLAMSASFHAEITTFALQLLALICLLRAAREDSPAWAAACSLALAAAALNRQTNVVSFAGALAYLWLEGRFGRRLLAGLLIPGAVLLAGYALWFVFGHGVTWAWEASLQGKGYAVTVEAGALLRPASWHAIALRAAGVLSTTALLLLPLSLATLPEALRRPVGPRERWALLAAAALSLYGVLAGGGMPLIGNTITRLGLGVVTIEAAEMKPAGFWSSPALWRAVDLLCLVSALSLTRIAFALKRLSPLGRAGMLLYLPAYLLIAFSPVLHYDRYLLIIVPWLIAALVPALQGIRVDWRLGAAGCAILILASALGLKDYFAWNRARWDAGMRALSFGVPVERLRNGFDWNGERLLDKNFNRLLASKPARDIGLWDWAGLDRALMYTSFDPDPRWPGFARAQSFPYRSPLLKEPGFVHLHGYRR